MPGLVPCIHPGSRIVTPGHATLPVEPEPEIPPRTKDPSVTLVQQALAMMAAPKKWEMSDGDTLEVHTPFTTRAKELLELHRGLTMGELTTDERLDVLLHVKWTVKEFDCNLTREIVDLIDREADLLNRGRAEKTLEGLRRRTANLFLQFIETPEFNPESTRLTAVPRDLMMRQNVQPISSGQQ